MFDPELLLAKGDAAATNGLQEDARDCYAQAVAEARWVDKPALLAQCLRTLAEAEHQLRHQASALDSYTEAALVSQHLGDAANQARALLAVAEIYLEQKSPSEAEKAYDQVITLCEAKPGVDAHLQAQAFHGMAKLTEVRKPAESLLLWQAAITLYEAAGENEKLSACKLHVAFLTGC